MDWDTPSQLLPLAPDAVAAEAAALPGTCCGGATDKEPGETETTRRGQLLLAVAVPVENPGRGIGAVAEPWFSGLRRRAAAQRPKDRRCNGGVVSREETIGGVPEQSPSASVDGDANTTAGGRVAGVPTVGVEHTEPAAGGDGNGDPVAGDAAAATGAETPAGVENAEAGGSDEASGSVGATDASARGEEPADPEVAPNVPRGVVRLSTADVRAGNEVMLDSNC